MNDTSEGVECECECEDCMFRYINPPNMDREAFENALASNFRSGDFHLRGPLPRNFKARPPREEEEDIPAERPDCTEMIPWNHAIQDWTDPCPNNSLRHRKRVLPCLEVFCPGGRNRSGPYQAIANLPRRIENPGTADGRRYVCEDHWEDTKAFFELQDPRKIYRSHLVRFCETHERRLLTQHQENGYNSCTCTNVDLTKWQCRACFQNKVAKMQRNFRRRVEPKWFGEAAGARVISHSLYYKDWRKVRKMLQERHPCSQSCGAKRQSGLYQQEALDCRCCGGIIIRPAALFPPMFPPVRRVRPVRPPPPPPTRRSARLAAIEGPRRSARLAGRS